MNVDLYEKIWMWMAAGLIVLFLAAIGFTTFGQAIQPPSHIETIDPEEAPSDSRFAEPGVTVHEDGSATVVAAALMFAFNPAEIRVPPGRPVTFRLTSYDVIHGFQVVGTNANAMVIPGYVTQFTTTFSEPGEYLVVCNEYCGLGHHLMYATLVVEEPGDAEPRGAGS